MGKGGYMPPPLTPGHAESIRRENIRLLKVELAENQRKLEKFSKVGVVRTHFERRIAENVARLLELSHG